MAPETRHVVLTEDQVRGILQVLDAAEHFVTLFNRNFLGKLPQDQQELQREASEGFRDGLRMVREILNLPSLRKH